MSGVPADNSGSTELRAGTYNGGTNVARSFLHFNGVNPTLNGKIINSAELHMQETDVIYVVDGTATFVTGGTMVDGKLVSPGQLRGMAINVDNFLFSWPRILLVSVVVMLLKSGILYGLARAFRSNHNDAVRIALW